ncbi:phosphatidate cytidylyltransferase [Mesorhizobium marinum]|uniref:phosphatidate cytidylyltransferase n=1 Tax=Mesorhizobium marinum TaxID=3228790 RepID=UPI003F5BAD7A
MSAGAPGGGLSNLQLRIISSVVLITAVLAVTYVGGVAFRILAAAIAGSMFYEWCTISGKPGAKRSQAVAGVLLGVVLVAMVLGYAAIGVLGLLVLSVAASLLESRVGGQGGWAPSGLAYAGLAGLSLGWLRGDGHDGLVAILFLFAVVWATDICAYFVGRSLGGPKLAPAISPGKTQSGALGGAVGGVLAGVAVAAASGLGNLPLLALVAFALSVISQGGDLFESWIKRRHGVKDSGNLIPGHGGVFDRVDGLVAAAIALYLVGALMAGADNPAQGLFAS